MAATKFGRVKRGRTDLAWLAEQCANEALFPPHPDASEVPVYEQQTYNQWKAAFELHKVSHPLRVRQRRILLQPLCYSSSSYPCSCVESSVLVYLRDFCQAFFMHMSFELAPAIDLAEWRRRRVKSRTHSETQREQFLVGDIIRELQRQRPRSAFATLALTTVDLYPGEQWNFVLGQADFARGAAVSSLGRYFSSSDASSADAQLRHLWVLVKVVSHELCHLFGLSHCFYFECGMNASSSIEQASSQPLYLCPVCLRKLHKALGFSIAERYTTLLRQMRLLYAAMHEAVQKSGEGEHLQLMDSAVRWLDGTVVAYDTEKLKQ